MMNFESRVGPDFGDNAPTYPTNGVPDWYRDAKLGFFIHWGLYSVPAWAVEHGERFIPTEDAYAWHQYAEWYGNTVRIAGSPTWERHQEVYGPGVSYEDLADRWDAAAFDAEQFVGELLGAGAKYIVPVTKHHEGFCLWDTETTGFNSVARGPKRNLIGELHDATRRANARFGVYFSGALDWHVSDFPPIESDTDLFRFRRNDPAFSRYSAEQVDELIARFSPDVLWNDIDWPDGGKGHEDYGVASLLGRYFDAVPDGVVNDRWGVPYNGYLTREYTNVAEIQQQPWESTRGLGFSFGFNQDESEKHSLSGTQLVRHLVDVVSKNGNLLINVGPTAAGEIPPLQLQAMREMGAWLNVNGEGIYGTRPWIRAEERVGVSRRYTTSAGAVHVHVMEPEVGEVELPAELVGRDAVWADGSAAVQQTGADGVVRVSIPAGLRAEPVAMLTVNV
ncbi:alpha-L-fucosidase [Leucobacter sp. NPDC015123]|uniref:alpha-L-fucosidase n=1 Tax=Leucobacter sp. NPDC015123 TaxID=3364129 RepID=UPI0036F48EE5